MDGQNRIQYMSLQPTLSQQISALPTNIFLKLLTHEPPIQQLSLALPKDGLNQHSLLLDLHRLSSKNKSADQQQWLSLLSDGLKSANQQEDDEAVIKYAYYHQICEMKRDDEYCIPYNRYGKAIGNEFKYKLMQETYLQHNSKLSGRRQSANEQLTTRQFSNINSYLGREGILEYVMSPNQEMFMLIKLHIDYARSTENLSQISELRKCFLSYYLKKADDRSANLQPFPLIKLVELFHVSDVSFQNLSSLTQHRGFMYDQLYFCLCDFSNKGANSLAINVYGSILKDTNRYDQRIQGFMDLYLVLDSYGTHLIKDVWDNVYDLLMAPPQQEEQYFFTTSELLHCVLIKVENHTNNNVTKYCIQSLLAGRESKSTKVLFEHLPGTVYGSLIQILNTGTHYHDCVMFHNDSKMYELIRCFYLSYYELLCDPLLPTFNIQDLKRHIRLLIEEMNNIITFDHCLMAYIGILRAVPTKEALFGLKHVAHLVEMTNRFYSRLPTRKRKYLLESVLLCVSKHASFNEISLQNWISQFALQMPKQILQVTQSDGTPSVYACTLAQYHEKELRHKYYELQLSEERDDVRQSIVLECILTAVKVEFPTEKSVFRHLLSRVKHLSVATYAQTREYESAIIQATMFMQYGLREAFLTQMKQHHEVVEHMLLMLSVAIQQMPFNEDMEVILDCICSSIPVSSSTNPACSHYAKFVEFCMGRIHSEGKQQGESSYLFALVGAIKHKLQRTAKYYAIEECIYALYRSIRAQELGCISRKYKLRLQLMLCSILSNDPKFLLSLSTTTDYIDNIHDYCEIYDFEHLEELYRFFSIVVKAYFISQGSAQRQSEFADGMCSLLKKVIDSMLYNLDYGIHKKEVVSATDCALSLASAANFSPKACELVDFLLETGEKYWGFHRQTVFTIINLYSSSTLKQKAWPGGLKNIIIKLACIEEYRGEDSALILTEHAHQSIYRRGTLHAEADYDGTTLRFAVIDWAIRTMDELLLLSEEVKEVETDEITNVKCNIKFWLQVADECMRICSVEAHKQKMFLTGSHKHKIKLWQFMLAFPKFIIRASSDEECNRLITQCLSLMEQNNLTEVRHYFEIFLLKMIELKCTQSTVQNVCLFLKQKLLSVYGQTNLTKNVSYMLISGLILQLHYRNELYLALFSSVCSHVAYYRGISQYFCYQLISKTIDANPADLKYILILFEQFKQDEDAVKLANLLEQIVVEYKNMVKNWNVDEYLFNQKPTLNGQVVCDKYYVEQMKKIGHRLVKQNKNDDGFMPYREAWKMLAGSENGQAGKLQEQSNSSFQKKIDPSLDDIYNSPFSNQQASEDYKIKVMVVSSNSITLFGHLARISEIFGVDELCIPSLKIIEMEDFSNVSVTAEKWLNITEHGYTQDEEPLKKKKKKPEMRPEQIEFKQEKQEKVIRILRRWIVEGFKLFTISKCSIDSCLSADEIRLGQKCVLIIDQKQLLGENMKQVLHQQICFNPYFSSHVEATIFIWEFFKIYSLRNQSNN